MPIKLAIFASGAGTNAENLIQYFEEKDNIEVTVIISNRSKAGVTDIASKHDVPHYLVTKEEFETSDKALQILKGMEVDLIVLAGFLLKVPDYILQAYPDRIVNIHPALLPDFGGKGMYGKYVHEAVVAAGKKESGITIHLVNENYDEGRILFQEKMNLSEGETPDTLTQKIQALEHEHFPQEVEKYCLEQFQR